jgi:hypothetical protein
LFQHVKEASRQIDIAKIFKTTTENYLHYGLEENLLKTEFWKIINELKILGLIEENSKKNVF